MSRPTWLRGGKARRPAAPRASSQLANWFRPRLVSLEDRSLPNSAPVLDSLSATQVSRDGMVQLSGNYHDVDEGDTHTLTVNWGVGAPVTLPVSGGEFNITHPYTTSNTYQISVTVSDHELSSVPPTNGLVGHWPGDGNALDVEGGNNGTLLGGVTFGTGARGQAFHFNGTNGWIATNQSFTNGQSHTIAGWVYWNGHNAQTHQEIASWWNLTDPVPNRMFLGTSRAGGQGPMRYGDGWQSVPATLPTGRWVYVAATYDGTTNNRQVFLDGQLAASLPGSAEACFGGLLAIGRQGNAVTTGEYWNGRIDELRLYDRSLSANEIAVLASSDSNITLAVTNNPPPSASFVLRDMSGNPLPTVNEGQSFRLVATGGSTNDRYDWSITTPSGLWTPTGATVSFPFFQPISDNGTFSVSLTVSDPRFGDTATAMQPLDVNNLPPVLSVAQGDLDHGFGINGVATTVVSGGDSGPMAPAQLPDGRIVIPSNLGTGGWSSGGFHRFLVNGNPDTEFSGDGWQATTGTFDAYALQADKIVMATQDGTTVRLSRLNADGTPDTDFGTPVIGTAFRDSLYPSRLQMAVLPDGRIIIVGGTETGLALVRCDVNGVAEISTSVPTSYDSPTALLVQPDGKIVVADVSAALLRFQVVSNNFILDDSFGGYVSGNSGLRTGVADRLRSVAEGYFLGQVFTLALDPRPGGGIVGTDGVVIFRYTSDGQLDGSFGPRGDGVLSSFNGNYRIDGVLYQPQFFPQDVDTMFALGANGLYWVDTGDPPLFGLAVQPDGKIIVRGGPFLTQFVRLNHDGRVDTSLAADRGGLVSAPLSSGYWWPPGVLLQAAGRVTMVSPSGVGSIRLVRFTTASPPDRVFAGEAFTLPLSVTDRGPADQAAGFQFQIDWGDGTFDTPNGVQIQPTHTYSIAGSYTIEVTATDKNLDQSQPVYFTVTVTQFTAANLEDMLSGSLLTDPISGLPAVVLTAESQQDFDTKLAAIETMPPQSSPVAVVLNASGLDLTGFQPNIPAGLTLVVNGVIFHGGSPALTLNSGNLYITNSSFINATDAPTILVTGGRLTIRNSVIEESTGFDQAALRMTGGFVDLGAAADLGGNTVNVNGPGAFFQNLTEYSIPVVGVDFKINGEAYDPVPSSIQGLVWLDSNNNGDVDFGEQAIAGVAIALHGTDDLGNPVHRVTETDDQGIYSFVDLRPSNSAGYTITEAQPAGYLDGDDSRGTVNGVLVGSTNVNDQFSAVVLPSGSVAENYNFAERSTGGGTGQTATIGFWQNRKGQELIRALNGGAFDTQLGHWLAATFPNMYSMLDGMTNSQVAAHYKSLFARNGQSSPGGPPKTDAQVMATALAVYVTNQTLAGTTAVAYGFAVTATGVGTRTFNVGARGAAFGVANGSFVSVMDLLLAVNARSRNGVLYDADGNGQIDSTEAGQRTVANDVFSAINEAGGL